MLQFSRITAACVSLAYLAVVMIPCAPPAVVAAATAVALEASSPAAHADAADHAAAGHAGHGEHAAHANHSGHAGHAGHTPPAHEPAMHEQVATGEPIPQLSAPCRCGCGDAPDSTSSSSARIGFALERTGWDRALESAPVRYAAVLPKPPAPPHLGTDPVPI